MCVCVRGGGGGRGEVGVGGLGEGGKDKHIFLSLSNVHYCQMWASPPYLMGKSKKESNPKSFYMCFSTEVGDA